MTRISVDRASPAVKKFIRSLAIDASGVEVMLNGAVVCRILPPGQLSEPEKAAQLAEVRQLLREARDNSKRLPTTVVERNIRSALRNVRGKR